MTSDLPSQLIKKRDTCLKILKYHGCTRFGAVSSDTPLNSYSAFTPFRSTLPQTLFRNCLLRTSKYHVSYTRNKYAYRGATNTHREAKMSIKKWQPCGRLAVLLCILTMVLLTGCSLFKKKDCPEVDVVDSSGKMHWSCRSVANGAGGFKCANGYLGLAGCENCATCKCTNDGAGAAQRCKCM